MHNNGEQDEKENLSDAAGSPSGQAGTALATVARREGLRAWADKVLGKGEAPDHDRSLPAEVRRVRRGKFFLSRHEQSTFGSLRYPIFEHYCHGVVVGETVVDHERDGIWCFASHNDFDLIPEFMPPSNWPEYTRTSTGWTRSEHWPHSRRLEGDLPSIDQLIQKFNEIKRLS